MKVFVLMKAFRSEERSEVEAIYSTSELAEKACEAYSKHEKNALTQWASTYWVDSNGSTYWSDEFELDSSTRYSYS